MSLAFSGLKATASLGGKVTKTSTDGSVQVNNFTLAFAGSVPEDVTIWFHNQYTIAGSGSQVLDLSGTLEDAMGDSAVFTKVYGFIVKNLSTTANNVVEVGASNFAAWLGSATDYVVVGPNGCLFLFTTDGYTVTNSTADVFTIANPGGSSINVQVGIIGK